MQKQSDGSGARNLRVLLGQREALATDLTSVKAIRREICLVSTCSSPFSQQLACPDDGAQQLNGYAQQAGRIGS